MGKKGYFRDVHSQLNLWHESADADFCICQYCVSGKLQEADVTVSNELTEADSGTPS